MEPKGDGIDDSLLERLKALKSSSVDFDRTSKSTNNTSPTTQPHDDQTEKDLTTRFAALNDGKKNQDLIHDEIAAHPEIIADDTESLRFDDETAIEDVLATLESFDVKDAAGIGDWSVHGKEVANARHLLKEARRTLNKADSGDDDDVSGRQNVTPQLSKSPEQRTQTFDDDAQDVGDVSKRIEQEDTSAEDKQESRCDENEAIDKLMREAVGEARETKSRKSEVSQDENDATPEPTAQCRGEESTEDAEAGDLMLSKLDLPAAPSNLPLSREKGEGTDTFLPSAPTFQPNVQKSAEPSPASDDDVDTWCIICLDDATLQCIDCDGDLYCNRCWMEGHKGESAGPEERKHRALTYEKGKKERKFKQPKHKIKVGAG